eukprot:530580_1
MGTCCARASSRESRDASELEKLVDLQALQKLTEDDLDSKEVEEHWCTIMHHFIPKSREFVICAYCHNIETSLNLFIPNPIINIILLYVQVVSLYTLIQTRRAFIKQGFKHTSDNLFTIEKAIFRVLSMNKSDMSYNTANNETLMNDILQNYNCKKLSDFKVSFNGEIIYKSNAADRIEDNNVEPVETQRRAFADIAMEHKNEEILVTIVKTCSGNKQLQFKGNYLQEILNFTASNTMYSLCNLLMTSQVFKQIKFSHRPQCLLNAFHSRDYRIISCIINGLKSKKELFCLCDNAFEIEYMDCAEKVVKCGWFIPSSSVYERAVTEKNEIVLVMILRCHQYCRNGIWKHGHEIYPFCLSGARLRQMLCLASNNKMYYLANLLMNDNILHKIEFNARPESLLNAVQKLDGKMVSIILNGLKLKNKCFVCDDVFEECIITDNIKCAKCIVELHWYTPTKMDTSLAQQYSKAMYVWLLKRSVGCLYENDGKMRDNIGFDDWDTENSNTDWNIEDDNWD